MFKLIRPKSLIDPAYEEFEYLLRWVCRDGSECQYMFYDAEMQLKVANEVINEQDSERIESLVSKVSQDITVQADDLSRNDLTVMAQLMENKHVDRIFKNGTVERYAPDAQSYKYRLTDGRYTVDFKLIRRDIKAWR
jgi:hypothetical protein